MRLRDFMFLMLINLAWGFNIVPTRLALLEVPPLTAAAIRFAMVGLMCLPWLRLVRGQMWVLAGYGLASGAIMFGLNNFAFKTATNVSALSIAGQLSVPFSLILGIIFLGERIKLPRLLGIALSFAGVAWMSFDPAAFTDLKPLALLAAGSLAYAFGTLLQRQVHDVHGLTMQCWLAIFSLPPLVGLAFFLEPDGLQALRSASATAWQSMIFSAVCASIIGHAGISYLLQRYPISMISPLTLLAPILGVVFAVIFLHTPLSAKMIQGGIVTLLGVGIITVRTARRSPAPPLPAQASAP